MKGLCLEVRNGTSAILKEDGTVVKLNKVYRVGETIEVPEKKLLDFILDSSLVTRTVAVAAAVVALFVGGGLYSYNNLLAASYLSVDVNPSLEYTLNRANKVINVKALNEDADSVVKELKESGIKNSNISKTIAETARVMENEKYIADDKDNVMLIGITAGNSSSSTKITEEVQNAAKAELDGRVEVYTVVTSKAERNEAQKLGVSAGRYSTMKTIAAANGNSDEVQFSDNDIEEAMNESVAGLVKKADVTPQTTKAKADNSKKTTTTEEKTKAAVVSSNTKTTSPSDVTVTAPSPAPQVTVTASAKEEEEEKEEEKKKSSSSSKKKTTSGNKAVITGLESSESSDQSSNEKKDTSSDTKDTISTASAGKNTSASGSSTSDNKAGSSASGSSASGSSGSGSAESGSSATGTTETTPSTTVTVTTEEGSQTEVVVPSSEQIENPQDMTVDEYEAKYLEVITGNSTAETNSDSEGSKAETNSSEETGTEDGKAQETVTE